MMSGKPAQKEYIRYLIPIGLAFVVALSVLTVRIGGSYDVLLGLVHLSIVVFLARTFIMPRVHRSAGVSIRVLWLGLVFQLVGSAIMAYSAGSTGMGDAFGYHWTAIALVQRAIDIDSLRRYGTPAVSVLASVWYRLFGVSFLGMYFVSGLIAYLASCLMIRSVALLTNGRRTRIWASFILLFLPSFWIWNGIYGKEPYIALGTSTILYGVTLMSRSRFIGIVYCIGGVALSGIIRPHLAAIEAAALAVAAALAKRGGYRRSLIVVSIMMFTLLIGSGEFRTWAGIGEISLEGIVGRISLQSMAASGGGSDSGIGEIARAKGYGSSLPKAITAMFLMPYPGQFGGLLQTAASIETLFVFGLTLCNAWRSLITSLKQRELSGLYGWSFIGAYLVIMSVPLSANIGTMVRQRTVFWLVLIYTLAIGKTNRRDQESQGGSRSIGCR